MHSREFLKNLRYVNGTTNNIASSSKQYSVGILSNSLRVFSDVWGPLYPIKLSKPKNQGIGGFLHSTSRGTRGMTETIEC